MMLNKGQKLGQLILIFIFLIVLGLELRLMHIYKEVALIIDSKTMMR